MDLWQHKKDQQADFVPLARPWFGDEELKAVERVLRTGWWITGPEVELFEKEFAALVGSKHAIAVNSGSSALLIAMAVMGVGEGDEIIAPDMTFVSTASSALYLGAKPVFCDITLDDYGMDPVALRRCITKKTKLIVPVHYAGQSARLKEIIAIAKEHNIAVLEDAAESHLAEFNGKYSGTFGKMGIFSFTPSKPMTTGEGGMIVTDDADLAKQAKLTRSFYDVDKFKWQALGFNFRMPEMMGAIGREQLKKLPEAVRRRREKAAAYTEAFAKLSGLVLPYVRRPLDHNFQLYTIRLDLKQFKVSRDQWIAALHQCGVGARLYYPTLHDQGVFAGKQGGQAGNFPNATQYAATALSLPLHAGLTDDEQRRVIAAVQKVHRETHV